MDKIVSPVRPLMAARVISDCQPANNELQRIASRRTQLMKLSLSLAPVRCFLFLRLRGRTTRSLDATPSLEVPGGAAADRIPAATATLRERPDSPAE